MSTVPLSDHAPAELYYSALMWIVKSHSNPHESYVCELGEYSCNGRCDCDHFKCRLEPLLARLITPERAVQEGKVKLKAGMRVENALRCKHLIDARERFADAAIRTLVKARELSHANSTNLHRSHPAA